MSIQSIDYTSQFSVLPLLIVGVLSLVPCAIVFIVLMFLRKRSRPLKNGILGTGRVISVSFAMGGAGSQNCAMNLVVQATNIEPTAVQWHGIVQLSRWPSVGDDLPVSIDPRNPQKVSVLWNQIASSNDRAAAEAQRVAQAMRNGRQA